MGDSAVLGQAESPGVNGCIGIGDRGCPNGAGLTKLLLYGIGGGATGTGAGGTRGGRLMGVKGGGRIFCSRMLCGLGGFCGGLGKGSCDGEPVSC